MGFVDAARVGRSDREGAGEVDRAGLRLGQGGDLVDRFGEVLILAEEDGDIVRARSGYIGVRTSAVEARRVSEDTLAYASGSSKLRAVI